ncbi:hypothetical protein HPB49_025063 [Dermacentor silvarum]|uniref:Uncharacterized protein n=1 Tax=Dermacentor silvarum TaxID=543639 RepID=A0ACB8C6B3_DERSI|nr:hypothetical protein HPB49_025063 [Dermacentor silvarum]
MGQKNSRPTTSETSVFAPGGESLATNAAAKDNASLTSRSTNADDVSRFSTGWSPHAITSESQQCVLRGMMQLGIDLLRELRHTSPAEANLVLSPYGAASALEELLVGSRGNTAVQISAALHIPTEPRVSAYFDKCDREMPHRRRSDPARRFDMGYLNNVHHAQTLVAMDPETHEGEPLRLERFSWDFVNATEESREGIDSYARLYANPFQPSEILPKGCITPSSLVCMLNVVDFRGSWKQAFDDSTATREIFHELDGSSTTVVMVHQTGRFRVAKCADLHATAIELPYEPAGRSQGLSSRASASGVSTPAIGSVTPATAMPAPHPGDTTSLIVVISAPGSRRCLKLTGDVCRGVISVHNLETSELPPAPPPRAAETPTGQPLNMALLEQRGYDPTTLSWSSIPANQPEDGPPNISTEQAVIFEVVESRRRRRQNARGAATSKTPLNNSAKGDARAPSSSSKAPQKTPSPVSKWTPKPTVRMNPDDYVIVLKPRTTVALKTTFQQGELGAAISQLIGRQHMNAITISPNWEQNIIVCGTQNPEVVQKLLTDFQLNTSKGPLPLHGHLKLTGDVCRGVISVHNLETSELPPAPPPRAVETPTGQPLNMALLEQRGYDPTTLSWSSIPANQPEDGPPNISAEQAVIFEVVESRRRRRQNARGAATSKTPLNNSAKGDARAPSSSSKAPQKTPSPVSKWTPKPTVRMNPDDYVIVLKPRTTVALKTTFQQGELGAAISQLIGRQHMNAITISPNWEQNIIVCGTQNPGVVQKLLTDFQLNTSKGPLPLHGHLKLTGDVCRGVIYVHNLETKLTPVREYKTVPACYRCGTLGHRADNCANPVNERCGLCGQNVGAGTEGMAPHECNPMRQPAGKAPITPPKGANPGATRESHATGRQQVNQETPSRRVTSPPDKTAAATPLPGEAEKKTTDRELPTPIESRVAALETQVTAIETQLADLPKIIHDTIARQMDSVITQVTQAVTHIIQKWIQDNPRVLKRVGPIRDDNRPAKFKRVIPDESDFSEDSCTSAPGTSGLGSVNVTPPSVSDHGPQPQWNCRGLKDRKKRAHLRLYLETLEFLVAVVALEEPGTGEVTLPTTPPFSYTMVSVLPLNRSDPPVHILNIYCPPKLKSVTFSEIFTQAMQVAGRDPLLIVGDFNAPSRLWGELAELLSTLGLTLHTNPANPTRVGNSIQRDTCPDLTITRNIRHADWLNTEDTIGSDHCIINTTIYMRPLKRSLKQARVPDWTTFRTSLPIVDPLHEWTCPGPEFRLVVLLPDDEDGLASLEEKLSALTALRCFSNLKQRGQVQVSLPLFKVKQVTELAPVMSSLGVRDVFTDSAELWGSKLGDKRVTLMRHAAAFETAHSGGRHRSSIKQPQSRVSRMAHAVGALFRAPHLRTRVIKVDHPFAFFVTCSRPDAVMLLGSVRKISR